MHRGMRKTGLWGELLGSGSPCAERGAGIPSESVQEQVGVSVKNLVWIQGPSGATPALRQGVMMSFMIEDNLAEYRGQVR